MERPVVTVSIRPKNHLRKSASSADKSSPSICGKTAPKKVSQRRHLPLIVAPQKPLKSGLETAQMSANFPRLQFPSNISAISRPKIASTFLSLMR
jgi:hypothetical protein